MNNPDSALSQEGDDDGELFETAPANSFSIEPILTDAISASDIRQVVEQMHELHLKRDPSALKIIGLLTLLCSSGRAKKYFQNLLINALAIQDLEDYSLTGDFVQQIRPSSLQTNCMLFFTQYENRRWEVKFNSAFSFPAQQSKNQEQLRHKLEREGDSLKKLFAYYNTDDNAVLDVMESFELLEDLGLGGPFLYKEVSVRLELPPLRDSLSRVSSCLPLDPVPGELNDLGVRQLVVLPQQLLLPGVLDLPVPAVAHPGHPGRLSHFFSLLRRLRSFVGGTLCCG
jgi:hypothetical protein